jgi:hypothetical protein
VFLFRDFDQNSVRVSHLLSACYILDPPHHPRFWGLRGPTDRSQGRSGASMATVYTAHCGS